MSGFKAGTNSAQLAEIATVNIKEYGALEGVENVEVTTNAFKSAIAYLESNNGGILDVQDGDWYVNDTLVITGHSYSDTLDKRGITVRGRGIGATRITSSVSDAALFQLGDTSSKILIHFEDLELIGPGKATSSIGIYSKTVGGNYNWKNVLIWEFGQGIVAYDCTSGSYTEVYLRSCTEGFVGQWQNDIHTFINCRFDYCDLGLHLGGETFDHTISINNNCNKFIGCSFSSNIESFEISDAAASGISFESCYFEGNEQEGIIGIDGQSVSPSGVTFDTCYWLGYSTRTRGIIAYGTCILTFRECTMNADATVKYDPFIDMISKYSSLEWSNNKVSNYDNIIRHGERSQIIAPTSIEHFKLSGNEVHQVTMDYNNYEPAIDWRFSGATDKKMWSLKTTVGSTGATISEMYVSNASGVVGLRGVGIKNELQSLSGTTANRPSLTSASIGFQYFDTTLGYRIDWNGTAWVNSIGTVV